jgi:hypothetical protein
MTEPEAVALKVEHDVYEIVLLDGSGKKLGHGYRGPSKSRADQDLKYWTRTKGLRLAEPTVESD